MRIVVENGCIDLVNQGDIAMLQVAVSRLSSLWPHSVIQVITNAPDLLALYCPNTHPLTPQGHLASYKIGKLFGRLYRFVSRSVSQRLLKLEEDIWHCCPLLAQRWVQLKMKRRIDINLEEMKTFIDALLRANLVVASGGGYIADPFKWHVTRLLDTLEIATQLGTPTAMFSQGVSSIEDPVLRAKVKTVLSTVDIIVLREKRSGPQLLDSLGIPPSRVVIGADDAIESAYKRRTAKLGTGIGINLRSAVYSEVGSSVIETVRRILHDAAWKYRAPLIPLPLTFDQKESDAKTIQHLLLGHADALNIAQSMDDPLKIVDQVGRCRVVVTGSYHPAVFALAQGIPVVALAKSTYYIDKFFGLADQFGTGCKIVLLNNEQPADELMLSIENAWSSAEQIRPQLLEAAKRQVESSWAAYRRVYELVASRTAVT